MSERPLVTVHATVRLRVDAADTEAVALVERLLDGATIGDRVLIEHVSDVSLGYDVADPMEDDDDE